jgi:IS5 family transposase
VDQISFGDLDHQNKKKTTRRDVFLNQMDQIIPWSICKALIEPHYPVAGNGRPPKPLLSMLRIYFLQQWYNYSDPAMEEALYDIPALRQFAQFDYEQIPDESTILGFRHLLEKHELTENLFRLMEEYLSERGLILSEGTIVDASIVAAPPSTKNKDKARDPEMKQTKKGNQWHFGMKMHIGTDTQGRVHSVAVTDAAVHDSQVMEDLLHGEEQVIYGDKAYANQDKQADYEGSDVTWRINRKAKRGKKLNAADRAFNRKSNRTRARVEHAFGVVKNLWGYRKVRYKGIAKNATQVFTLFALANLYMARHQLLAVQD